MENSQTTKLSEIEIYAQTDVGMVRPGNEDNFLIAERDNNKFWTATNEARLAESMRLVTGDKGILLAIADGLGGALAGEVASHLAVTCAVEKLSQAPDLIGPYPFSEQLRFAIEQVNGIIFNESTANINYTGMGSTFTAAAIDGDQAYIAQVGDSRCYLIRNNQIVQLTKDQSLVGQLVDAGYITEDEAEEHSMRNVILQALGAQKRLHVIVDRVRLFKDDILLLCSDGLSGKVKRQEILTVIQEISEIKSACQKLISLANERGGEDNISIIIAKVINQNQEFILEAVPNIEKETIPRNETLPQELILEPLIHCLPASEEMLTVVEPAIDPLEIAVAEILPPPMAIVPPVRPSRTIWERLKRWLYQMRRTVAQF